MKAFESLLLIFSAAAKNSKAGPIVMQIKENDGGYFVTFSMDNMEN